MLLVDKAPDRTSHDVVARVRWLLGTRKVGHAGTLDPMATGVLVLGVGQGTRLLTHLVGLDKTYLATIRLGQATTTDDREGEPLGPVLPVTDLSAETLEAALAPLRGDVQQVPSTVSAIKIDGQRAYARVRAGEDVQLAARPVRISELTVLERRDAAPFVDLDVRVTCSSGTYVRAIARDLGTALGVGGHLTALRRTRVGPFPVEEGAHIPARGEGDPDPSTLPLLGLGAVATRVLPGLSVSEEQAAALGTGQRIEVRGVERGSITPREEADGMRSGADETTGDTVAAVDTHGRLVAIISRERGRRFRPVLVVPEPARS
ncbi:tRNA pseudouridine(55) synthase TruB [Brachybacterium sp. EF45031]|nr:tRNA pseudouridine(55) synthase TruB [Brachybacterium sillae]